MPLYYSGIPSFMATAYRHGALDANGQAPERTISDGGIPCRHCLQNVAEGDACLLLAYRPFPGAQPYAEVGPIFIHADECPSYSDHLRFPERERQGDGRILRGYGSNDRIVYGTGIVVSHDDIEAEATALLGREDVAYVHMRSATNNCFTLRIDKA